MSDALQIVQVSGVRQFVEIYDRDRIHLHLLQDEVRTDEACAARDENSVSHELSRVAAVRLPRVEHLIVIKKNGMRPSYGGIRVGRPCPILVSASIATP